MPSCAPAMVPTPAALQTAQVSEATKAPAPQETKAPAGTSPALTTATPSGLATPVGEATAFPTFEARLIELEWPAHLRLGNSDIVRVSLIPTESGYTVQAEFPEHPAQSQEVSVPRPPGYDLYAIGRLEGASFDLAPQGDISYRLDPAEKVTWRWSLTPRSPGSHRLALSLRLRWEPQPGSTSIPRESMIFSRALQVDVTSILGLTDPQAAIAGIFLVLLVLSACAMILLTRRGRRPLEILRPNPAVGLEPLPGSPLPPETQNLLRALFSRYARVVVTAEFRSGYSGSRTWLVLPVHLDGRRDASTIVKVGPAPLIQAEFENYETFVKDTLPPVTARIQQPPVGLPARLDPQSTIINRPAALRYTFIGQTGQTPTSLRQVLLNDPDPAYLERLFETFGPNWWMQRRPATFRLAEEYDQRLPAHFVLEPCQPGDRATVLDGRQSPGGLALKAGEKVMIRHFAHRELRVDGQSYALEGSHTPGAAPLRVRWIASPAISGIQPIARRHPKPPSEGSPGRVVATRYDLLRQTVNGLDRFGLPDPIDCLPVWLDETISGSQSVIHGDLNLENILVGPGGLVWLIDFARTRLGHPLADFAHLEAEIIAQVLAIHQPSPEAFLSSFQNGKFPLIAALEGIASRCLANPSQPREYSLGLAVTCLGMLKYSNLTPHACHCLYLTAAWLIQKIN